MAELEDAVRIGVVHRCGERFLLQGINLLLQVVDVPVVVERAEDERAEEQHGVCKEEENHLVLVKLRNPPRRLVGVGVDGLRVGEVVLTLQVRVQVLPRFPNLGGVRVLGGCRSLR